MDSKTEKISAENYVSIANEITKSIINADVKVREPILTSEELFRIDSAILSSLKKTTDFSRDLLNQLETGNFDSFITRSNNSFESEVAQIQQNVIADITQPLRDMFEEISNFITEDTFIRS